MRLYLLIFLLSVAFCSQDDKVGDNKIGDKIGPRRWLRVLNETEVAFVRQRCNPQEHRKSTIPPKVPTKPSGKPASDEPTVAPSGKTTPGEPTMAPSGKPTPGEPTIAPSGKTTPGEPTIAPSGKTTPGEPTIAPSGKTTPGKPTIAPSGKPATGEPTIAPSGKTTPGKPTIAPSRKTTPGEPTIAPSGKPTSDEPTIAPSGNPTEPSNVQERVMGGSVSKPGDFKHAVVFVKKINMEVGRDKEETLCSGTLISQWHVLTSRHCWDNLGKNTQGSEGIWLKFGGVCYAKSDNKDDKCDEDDMKTTELDFVIFDWDPEKGLRGDLAIAQLKRPIPEKEGFETGLVDIACLPQIREATLPDEFQITGWGLVGKDGLKKKTTRLHNVTVKTRIDCFGVDPINYGFCGAIEDEDDEKQGAGLPGDSGGGAVHWSEELGRYVVIGVQSLLYKVTKEMAPAIKHKTQIFTKMISTSNYIDDMCQYLGLCGDKPYGFFPVLEMGSVYLENVTRTLLKPLGPFRMIDDWKNNGINEACSGTRKMIKYYMNGSTTLPSVGEGDDLVPPVEVEEDDKCWAAKKNGPSAYSFELVSNYLSNKTAHCALTAVTDIHFVTSRDCVKKAVKSIIKQRKNLSYLASRIINRPWHVRLANEDEEVQSRADDKKNANFLLPVEMIAWSNLPYGLSIVQLANNSQLAERGVNFACLQHTEEMLPEISGSPEINVAKHEKKTENLLLSFPRIFFDLFRSDDSLNEAASETDLDKEDFTYGVVKKCNDTQKYLCAKPSHRKVSKECLMKLRKKAKKPKQQLDGHGIYDLYRYAFVGIQLANEELKTVGWEMYLAAKAFSGTLCIFLNRCEFESHTFNSAVDYFNNIYKFN